MVRFPRLLVILLLVLPALALADELTDLECVVDEECAHAYGEGMSYCAEEGFCALITEDDAPEGADAAEADTADTEAAAAPAINESVIQGLQDELLALRSASASVESRVKALEDFSLALRDEVQSTQAQQGILQQQVDSLEEKDTTLQADLDEKVGAVATGLAATQTDVESLSIDVEKERSFTKFLTGFFIFLIVLGATITVLYFVLKKGKRQETRQQEGREVQPEIARYITTHIQQGKKYPDIKAQLLQAGWAEDDIQWAYKETMRQNYQKYQQQKGGKAAPSRGAGWGADTKRTLSIGIVTVLLVVGVIVLLRGVTTGQAIQFGSIGELDTAVAEALERNLATSAFYPLVPFVDMCVQVQDGEKSVSYHVLKTSRGDTIEPVIVNCDADPNYDFAAKFLNWQSFEFVTNDLTCANLQQVNGLAKNVVVLPSRYVLPGFALNPAKNPGIYCPALKSCVSEQELALAGIDCSKTITAKTRSVTTARIIQPAGTQLPKAR